MTTSVTSTSSTAVRISSAPLSPCGPSCHRQVTPAELDDDAVREVEEQLDGAGVTWRWHEGPHGLSGADEILTAVEEVDVTLVVIGVTDRSHVQKRIVSDTTKQVLLDASCAVLAVRADHEAPAFA